MPLSPAGRAACRACAVGSAPAVAVVAPRAPQRQAAAHCQAGGGGAGVAIATCPGGMEEPAEKGGGSAAEGPAALIAEIRAPGPRPLRLLEWKVSVGAAVQIGSVLALCAPLPPAPRPAAASPGSGASPRPQRSSTERKLKAERPGVVRELCARPGQVIAPG